MYKDTGGAESLPLMWEVAKIFDFLTEGER